MLEPPSMTLCSMCEIRVQNHPYQDLGVSGINSETTGAKKMQSPVK